MTEIPTQGPIIYNSEEELLYGTGRPVMKGLVGKYGKSETKDEEFVKSNMTQAHSYERQTKNQCLNESGLTGKQFRKFMKKYRRAEREAQSVQH